MKRYVFFLLVMSGLLISASAKIITGGDMKIYENVYEDLIILGGDIEFAGDVLGNVIIGGGDIKFSGSVGENMVIFGGKHEIMSDIDGSLSIFGGDIDYEGEVQGNAKIKGGDIRLLPGTMIHGDLEMRGVVDNEALVLGETAEIGNAQDSMEKFGEGLSIPRVMKDIIFAASFVTNLIVLFVLYKIFGDGMDNINKLMDGKKFKYFLEGLSGIILIPVILIIMMATLILIPVSILGLLIMGLMLYLSRFMIFSVLSDMFVGILGKKPVERHSFRNLFFGFLIFEFLGFIPALGWLIRTFLEVVGFGALFAYVRGKG